jgi:hypothetical protein
MMCGSKSNSFLLSVIFGRSVRRSCADVHSRRSSRGSPMRVASFVRKVSAIFVPSLAG